LLRSSCNRTSEKQREGIKKSKISHNIEFLFFMQEVTLSYCFSLF